MRFTTWIAWQIADSLGYVPRPKRRSIHAYAIRRAGERRYWTGPYRYKGKTFSTHARMLYLVGTVDAAQAAVECSTFMATTKTAGLTHVEIVKIVAPSRAELKTGIFESSLVV